MIYEVAAADGSLVRYRDHKRQLYLFSVVMPLVTVLSVALFAATDGALWTTLVPLLFIFGFVPLADALLGEDFNNPPDAVVAAMEQDPWYRRLALGATPVYWISFLVSAAFAATADLPLWSYIAFVIGVGTINGGAIAVGHELGHKQNPLDRTFANLCNAVVGYAHFRIEHNRGHHTWASTPEDPASARLGESIYAFALRELPGAFRRGWSNEAERLRRSGKRVWSPENEILQGFALTAVVAAALVAVLGWKVLPFILAHHFIGWYALTQANYVEHYGLLREKRANGRYEPVAPRHSWNTNHIFSNLITFHLQRHSDHHAHPLRPYQALRDFPDLPRLPSGYPGMYLLAAIPPLWFRVMDPRVAAWAGGDLDKTNLHAPARRRLERRFAPMLQARAT